MDLLCRLQAVPGPSGDEGPIADFVQACAAAVEGVTVRRIGDLVIASRGRPSVAVFAHLDTIGFTLGHNRALIPIGGPHVKGSERVVRAGGTETAKVRVDDAQARKWRLSGKQGEPGSRWVYAEPLQIKKDTITGPYLDNRAGVWSALRTLERCEDVAVFFTPGEEHSGRGALIASRIASQELGINRVLISDITWHTDAIKNGRGPAISFRDRYVPRQRFLDEVLAAADASSLPYQREVERDGGSDGSYIERSTFPIDWVFIGAPQKRSHTPREQCRISDLHAMVEFYARLVPALSR